MQRLRDVDQMQGYFRNGFVLSFDTAKLNEMVDHQRLLQRLQTEGQAYGSKWTGRVVEVWITAEPQAESVMDEEAA